MRDKSLDSAALRTCEQDQGSGSHKGARTRAKTEPGWALRVRLDLGRVKSDGLSDRAGIWGWQPRSFAC